MGKQSAALTVHEVLNSVVSEEEVAELQAAKKPLALELEEGHAASSGIHAQCGPECHNDSRLHSSSTEEEANKTQR